MTVIETEIMRHMDGADTEFSKLVSCQQFSLATSRANQTFSTLVKGAGLKEKTLDGGAATILAAAFTPNVDHINGSYWKDCQPTHTMEHAVWTRGEENADRLWELSEACVGQTFA